MKLTTHSCIKKCKTQHVSYKDTQFKVTIETNTENILMWIHEL
jgi:hypothetical protein